MNPSFEARTTEARTTALFVSEVVSKALQLVDDRRGM